MSVAAVHSRASLIPLDNVLGAWLIGLILSAALFGVTCLQVYLYFTKHCARDPAFVKVFVALLLSMDILHLALTSHVVYSVTVTNFGDYVRLSEPIWSLSIQSAIGFLLSALVQLFYAFRVYMISNKNPAMPMLIAITAFVEFGLGIAFTRNTLFQTRGFSEVTYPAAALSLGVACDVLVAIAMVYYLLKNKTEFQKTNKAINLLVSYCVSSGGLTMVFAICSLVSLVSSTTMLYTLFFFVTVRLYGLSFMTVLNSREHVREQMFSSQAMVTLPSDGLSARAIKETMDEDTNVFDTRSKNEAQVV
ncbi:hypothetical protein DFH06DRAFT_1293079 [Mycena polygramma]|nr:hypothetical protein DFH06DRAFT_1293079 [Mycena polygramma]